MISPYKVKSAQRSSRDTFKLLLLFIANSVIDLENLKMEQLFNI